MLDLLLKKSTLNHSCSIRTVRTVRLGKSSGTLWNFTNFTFCWTICRRCLKV